MLLVIILWIIITYKLKELHIKLIVNMILINYHYIIKKNLCLYLFYINYLKNYLWKIYIFFYHTFSFFIK